MPTIKIGGAREFYRLTIKNHVLKDKISRTRDSGSAEIQNLYL